VKYYTTIYFQHKKTLKYERVDFEGSCTEAEAKILAAVFKPKGHRLHKIVHTTITGGSNDKETQENS